MKYLALLSLIAFAIHPETWLLTPAFVYIAVKAGGGIIHHTMMHIANDLHNQWWKR